MNPTIYRDEVLEQYSTPFRAYLRSVAEDQLMNNLSPLLGHAYDVTTDKQTQGGFTVDEFGGTQDVIPRPRIDAATARQKATEAGVKVDVPESGMSEEVLNDLIDRRQRQKVIDDAMSRSPFGLRSLAGFGVRLAVGLLDPLNVAAAFIPVVGEARYASMLAAASGPLGRAGVRAGVGAIEGAVGMAALEPATYVAHRALQDDYKAIDSLTNIAFGAGLGSLLHAGGGALKDAIKRPGAMELLQSGQTPVEFHLQSGPTPVDISLVHGETPLRPVSPDFVGQVTPAAQDLSLTLQGGKPIRRTMEQAPAIQAAGAQAESTLRATVPLVRGDEFSLTKHIADLFGLGPREGLSYKIVGFDGDRVLVSRLGELPVGTKRLTSFKASDLQGRISAGEIAVNAKTTLEAAISKAEMPAPERIGGFTMTPEEPPFYSAKATIERVAPQTHEAAMRTAVAQMAQGQIPDVGALIRADPASGLEPSSNPMGDVLTTAERQMSPDAVRVADSQASEAGAQRLAEAPKSHDLKAAEADLAKTLQDLTDRGIIKEPKLAEPGKPKEEVKLPPEIQAADKLIEQADELARAARAAGMCDL